MCRCTRSRPYLHSRDDTHSRVLRLLTVSNCFFCLSSPTGLLWANAHSIMPFQSMAIRTKSVMQIRSQTFPHAGGPGRHGVPAQFRGRAARRVSQRHGGVQGPQPLLQRPADPPLHRGGWRAPRTDVGMYGLETQHAVVFLGDSTMHESFVDIVG
jgi:hypothetical protein